MSDLTIFSDDASDHHYLLKVNDADPEIAAIRTYHFDSLDEAQDLAAGILNDCPQTDLDIFHNGDTMAIDKFDLYDDIDDMPFPLASGQLLGALGGEVDHDVLWDLAHGDFDAADLIPDITIRAKANRIMDRLDGIKAWDDDLTELDALDEMDINTTEFEHCARCGFDTIHNLSKPSHSLHDFWVCSLCGTSSAGVFRI